MSGYTSVFGGTTLYPSDVSYIALTLGDSVVLEWPLENSGGTPAARVIDVLATDAARSITLPDATLVGPGQTILFNSLASSTQTFNVLSASGATLAAISPGRQWQLYLADTSTPGGVWRVFQFGASNSTVQASALAGYGVTAIGAQLSQAMAIQTFNSSPRTLLLSDRAAMMTWTGTGSGTLNLPAAADAGNGFFISVRNSGGGTYTIAPNGAELIDGSSSFVLQPGESASLGTEGSEWYSLGFGQSAVFAFDYLDIDVGGLSGTLTLSGSQLNRTAYRFHGLLANDLQVVVPPTIQQYWVDNSTTGAFALTLGTSGGTPVATTQGLRSIYYCNGANVVNATTATVAGTIPATQGGTGQTSYTVGDLLVASSAVGLSKLAAVATGNVLISGGVGVLPSWDKVGLTTHVSGVLPVTNGGTGAATLPAYGLLLGNDTSPVSSVAAGLSGQVLVGNTGAAPSWAALNTIAVTSLSFGSTGLTPAAGTQGAVTVGGTLVVANGGTGTATLTANRLLKGNGTSAVSASSISDNGTTVTINGTVGFSIARTAVTAPAGADGNVFSGTYTPTLTNVSNVTSSAAVSCQYLRVGDVVTVSGRVDVTATTVGTSFSLGISLPIASALTSNTQCSGTAAYISGTVANNTAARIAGDTVNDTALLQGNATVNTSASWHFTFTYLVL